MLVVEMLTAFTLLALAAFTTVALFIGLMGVLGAVRFVRCERCGHLGLTSTTEPLRTCTYCHHDRLLHPIDTVHHAHLLHRNRHQSHGGLSRQISDQLRTLRSTAAKEGSRP